MDTVRQIVIEGTVCGNGEPVMSGIHSLGGGGAAFSAMDGHQGDQLKYHNIIAGKFGEEFNLLVWQIDWPTAELKSANIKS